MKTNPNRVGILLSATLGLLALVSAGCVVTPAFTAQPAPAAVAPSSAKTEPPAPAPAAPAESTVSDEYFEPGILLAGHRQHAHETTLFDIPYYPARALTTAEPGAPVRVSRVHDGAELETPYVYESMPLGYDYFDIYTAVFFVGDTDPRTPAELAAMTEWRLGLVQQFGDPSGIVTLTYFNGYWNEWRTIDIHMRNIRQATTRVEVELPPMP